LIAIDDVESLIQAETQAAAASATPPPTRLIGVPPSKGRGGNQTPRSDSIYITGSQPLPSPSSSFSSTTALDKLAFGMSKIDDVDSSKPTSFNDRAASTDETARKMSSVSLETPPTFDKTERASTSTAAGPSLLSQQAPEWSGTEAESSEQRASSSGRSIGGKRDFTDDVNGLLEEKITVKIADLGNGRCSVVVLRLR
jgi:serine/threonine-protein kinase SRPK3